ncbi:MAG TPA: hypothetical protein VLS96_17775, partial [Nodosilinea sp.]|nr:hypothetical protein [Nodosilinea sp.]
LGGVAVAMTEADIRQTLGAPQAVVDEATACCGLLRQLEYPTLTIGLIKAEATAPGQVYSLQSRTAGVATAAGVTIGDSRQRLIAAYGPPHDTVVEGRQQRLAYAVEHDADRLTFTLEGGRITAIAYYALLN